jgi:hypothetical protein
MPPRGLFISCCLNLMRRNLTKGQLAIGLAMIYPETETGCRSKKSAAKNMLETSGFSADRLDQAERRRYAFCLQAAEQ